MGAAPGRPPSGDAERLLRLVRHLHPGDFARTFHTGLSDAQLLGVIAALPSGRRDGLLERARHGSVPPAPGRWAPLERRPGRPLAVALHQARGRAAGGAGRRAWRLPVGREPVGTRPRAVRAAPGRPAARAGGPGRSAGRPGHGGAWAAGWDAGELTGARTMPPHGSADHRDARHPTRTPSPRGGVPAAGTPELPLAQLRVP